MIGDFVLYIEGVSRIIEDKTESVDTISILPGKNKGHIKEEYDQIILKKGEVIALVGQTGSGKSRLLEDIERCANGDTPTERIILINKEVAKRNDVGKKKRKLIAQLSQNMNFVLDMTVKEFLQMHVRCFHTENADELVKKVYEVANKLAGEPFDINISVTSLSGGQSRALMIADCAILSVAPIVLIDEIENAGINRRKALELLTGEDKIVVVATHNPVLALLADKRLIIDNGGIIKIIEKNKEEQKVLKKAEKLDEVLVKMREELRLGKTLSIS